LQHPWLRGVYSRSLEQAIYHPAHAEDPIFKKKHKPGTVAQRELKHIYMSEN